MKNLPNVGKVNIIYKRCKACGICYNFCPRDVYVKKLKGKPQVDVEGRCTACKLCEYLCPDFAIKIEKRGD